MTEHKKYNLFLDDRRTLQMAYDSNPGLKDILQKNEILIVKNATQFITCIQSNGLPEFITFDHDLADFFYEKGETRERTGNTCAKWLGEYCMKNKLLIPFYYVHSDNSVGRKNIKGTLDFYSKHINL